LKARASIFHTFNLLQQPYRHSNNIRVSPATLAPYVTQLTYWELSCAPGGRLNPFTAARDCKVAAVSAIPAPMRVGKSLISSTAIHCTGPASNNKPQSRLSLQRELTSQQYLAASWLCCSLPSGTLCCNVGRERCERLACAYQLQGSHVQVWSGDLH